MFIVLLKFGKKGTSSPKYWVLNNILDHFGIPVLFVSGCHQQVLKTVNNHFLDNSGTPEMFQYLPIILQGRSSIWDLKYTFSKICYERLNTKDWASHLLLEFIIVPKNVIWEHPYPDAPELNTQYITHNITHSNNQIIGFQGNTTWDIAGGHYLV